MEQRSIVIEERVGIGALSDNMPLLIILIIAAPGTASREAAFGRPLHGPADILVGFGALHSNFFPIIDERRPAEGELQRRRDFRLLIVQQPRADARLIVVGEERRKLPRRIACHHRLLRQPNPARTPTKRGLEDRIRQIELESHVHLVAHVLRHLVCRTPNLAHGEGFRREALVKDVKALEPGQRARGVHQDAILFHQMLDCIQTETVHAHLLQPEANDVLHLRSDGGILVIEIGHLIPEDAEVVRAAAIAVPARPRRTRVGPEIPVAQQGIGVSGLLEPGMLRGGVVEHQVNNDADAPRVRRFHQRPEILQRAVFGVHVVVIHHVIAVIAGRRIDGHEPDAGDAEVVGGMGIAIVEVVELLNETLKVADTIAIAIIKTADENLVEDGIVPPGIAAGAARQRAIERDGRNRLRLARRGGQELDRGGRARGGRGDGRRRGCEGCRRRQRRRGR